MSLAFYFNAGFQSIVLLFFIIQDLVFAFLLFRKGVKDESSSDRWLGLLVILCAMYLTPWMFGHAGWYAEDGYREFLFFVPFHQYFLFGPVMYFLTRSLTSQDSTFKRRDLLHLVPALMYFIYSAIVAVWDLLIAESFYFYADGMDKDLKPWYQIIGLTSMVVYAVLSLTIYQRYRKKIYETLSYADAVRLKWLKEFLFALLLIIVFRAVFIVLFPGMGDWGYKWWYYTLFGLISFYLAISGYTSSVKLSTTLAGAASSDSPENDHNGQRSSLSERDIKAVMAKVKALLEKEKRYRDPALSLSQLAAEAGTNTSILSKSINQGTETNFNDFINGHRIEAVKKAIGEGELEHKTLVGIALESGFNSKSTFIRSFKKQEGMTPSEYVKSTLG